MPESLKNKKVLQMGLGILGGGAATARFLVEQGTELTVTDMKTAEFLKPSLDKLADISDKIKFVLGEHREEDFLETEIVVANPDVPVDSKFLRLAKKEGKQIENELSLFYRFCQTPNLVGVTGTRGKTTTSAWTAHLLGCSVVGNSPDKPFLGEVGKVSAEERLVVETPSFQLELLGEFVEGGEGKLAPRVALITNLYRDHINRHKTMEGYALAKANIFKYQTEDDFLILNKEDEWTDFFLSLEPKARILFFSKEDKFGLVDSADFIKTWGEHNLLNLQASILVAKTLGVSDEEIKSKINTLPQVKFRQEKVFDDGRLRIYNDTTATSPDGAIAAIKRFSDLPGRTVFVMGGTDRELEYGAWGLLVNQKIKPENLILLAGSATEKMKKELDFAPTEFETLAECLAEAFARTEGEASANIVFSPGAKSFEKFKNEFDRGEQFNDIVNSHDIISHHAPIDVSHDIISLN